MTLVTLLSLTLSLQSVPSLPAESAADPLSGRWVADSLTYLELKLEGQTTVSGTVIWRHGSRFEHRSPVREGTFDPKSGAVKLEGETRQADGSIVGYVIEARVDQQTLTGTYRAGTASGEFSFTRIPLKPADQPGKVESAGVAHPMSGTWAGYMARDEAHREQISVTVLFDGRTLTGRITGPAYPGRITGGTFDAVTGAFELQIQVQDESQTKASFTGTMSGDSASGRVHIGGAEAGVFSIRR